MITVIIGQRGTGKTSLLNRISLYARNDNKIVQVYDLDREISRGENKSIEQIFSDQGEEYFRALEKKYFDKLVSEIGDQEGYLSVGGGFNPSWIGTHQRILWLQRGSERWGRIFLDRPPLSPGMSPLDEFFSRADQRGPKYKNAAWEEYLIPEGLKNPDEIEKQILIGEPQTGGGILTLLPHHFTSNEGWSFFIRRRLKWGIKYFEIRDDLLNSTQIEKVLQSIPKTQLLWSRRRRESPSETLLKQVAAVDYDLSLLPQKPIGDSLIISVHEYGPKETLSQLLQKLLNYESLGLIKLAVKINNWNDFEMGHQWAQANSARRNFLPRSDEGRWLWYRLWLGSQQSLNFFREGEGSAADQPSLYQWLRRESLRETLQKSKQNTSIVKRWNEQLEDSRGGPMAAILGSPVDHSFTPIVQGGFFARWGVPVLPIALDSDEFQVGFSILNKLGLVAAAVTSPLKIKAYEVCEEHTNEGQTHQSVNTIILNRNLKWVGHNTDGEGLRCLFAEAQRRSPCDDQSLIAVWGGGGTLPLLRMRLPKAKYFSLQSGNLREGAIDKNWKPQWIIWAGGRFGEIGTQTPPANWHPKLVVDLNYREDSGGRELAQKLGAQYVSGEVMFEEQAEHQRQFWSSYLD